MSTLVTPRKPLCPFAPLVSHSNRQRSISPPPDIDCGVNNTPMPASSGMFLLIRNVLPDSKTAFGKPVEMVKKAIAEIIKSPDGKDLADITVLILPGGRVQDRYSSSAYLELAKEIRQLDSIPRSDLLMDWMNALSKSHPTWDVVWAPQKKGKDRRMTIRFRVADSKEKVPTNATEKIRAHLESKGHRTIGGYISYNGLVDISLADTNSIDTILASHHYIVPTISKEGMHVSPPKFIPINHPFELCIGGLNDYEGVHEIIEKWLYYKYVHDDKAKTTRVYDTRISPDREYFIFTMDSWESTLAVLKDNVAFREYFTHSPLLSDPKLLFELNSIGFARKSTTATIDAGAGAVNEAITDLRRDLADFRKEQNVNNLLVQRQVASIHDNMENQTNAVALLGNQLQQFGLSLLSGRDEKMIEAKISAIDNNLSFETQCLRTTDDLKEKTVIKANISTLQNERREQTLLLAKACDATLRLIGPAPGTLVPAATAQTPGQPSAPADISEPITRPSTPDTPTPTNNHTASDTLTPTFSTPTPFNFDFSSIVTPPLAVRFPTATKRNKQHHPLQTAPKRIKSTERHTITRSTSKNTLATQSVDDVNLTNAPDVFNDYSDVTVCPSLMPAVSILITAPADQGQCNAHGSRPLNAGCQDTSTPSYILEWTDQLGRALITKLISRKHVNRSHTSNPMSFLLYWFLIGLTLLILTNTTEATHVSAGSLSFYALNTNGFVHPTKIDATNRAISFRNPDIVVITETKTNSSRTSKLSYEDYQFFEERGIPASGHHLYKWGVILGVKKGITVSQRVPVTHPALIGRLIAVDIVIPLDSRLGLTHRVIAAYAPWDIHDNSDTAVFWSEAAKLCLNNPNSWTLLGDLNATVIQAERKSGGTDARAHFTNFLRVSKGLDLWSKYPERSRFTDWTCKPRLSTNGGSIIDRIVTSSSGIIDSEILVADGHNDFVPMTDHRAIVGRLILKPPDRNSNHCLHDTPAPVLNNPRIKFPGFKDKHLFQAYCDETDSRIKLSGLHLRTVTDHNSFIFSTQNLLISSMIQQLMSLVELKGSVVMFTRLSPIHVSNNFKPARAQ